MHIIVVLWMFLIRNLTKTDNFTAKLQRDFLNDFSEFLEVKYFKDNIGYEDKKANKKSLNLIKIAIMK